MLPTYIVWCKHTFFLQYTQLHKVGATNDTGADAVLQDLFSLSMMESYISSGQAGNSSEVTLLSLIVKQVVSDTCLYVRKFAWSMLCWLCIHVQQYNTSNIDHIT